MGAALAVNAALLGTIAMVLLRLRRGVVAVASPLGTALRG
jgi:hypothetical protein